MRTYFLISIDQVGGQVLLTTFIAASIPSMSASTTFFFFSLNLSIMAPSTYKQRSERIEGLEGWFERFDVALRSLFLYRGSVVGKICSQAVCKACDNGGRVDHNKDDTISQALLQGPHQIAIVSFGQPRLLHKLNDQVQGLLPLLPL